MTRPGSLLCYASARGRLNLRAGAGFGPVRPRLATAYASAAATFAVPWRLRAWVRLLRPTLRPSRTLHGGPCAALWAPR